MFVSSDGIMSGIDSRSGYRREARGINLSAPSVDGRMMQNYALEIFQEAWSLWLEDKHEIFLPSTYETRASEADETATLVPKKED